MKEFNNNTFQECFKDNNLAKRYTATTLKTLKASGCSVVQEHGKTPLIEDGLYEEIVPPTIGVLSAINTGEDTQMHETKQSIIGLATVLTKGLLWRHG